MVDDGTEIQRRHVVGEDSDAMPRISTSTARFSASRTSVAAGGPSPNSATSNSRPTRFWRKKKTAMAMAITMASIRRTKSADSWPRVKCGLTRASAGHVGKHDGRRPPVRDEREHHAADDDHLDRPAQAVERAGRALGFRLGLGRRGHRRATRRELRSRRGPGRRRAEVQAEEGVAATGGHYRRFRPDPAGGATCRSSPGSSPRRPRWCRAVAPEQCVRGCTRYAPSNGPNAGLASRQQA
jgi:hypothetical protein